MLNNKSQFTVFVLGKWGITGRELFFLFMQHCCHYDYNLKLASMQSEVLLKKDTSVIYISVYSGWLSPRIQDQKWPRCGTQCLPWRKHSMTCWIQKMMGYYLLKYICHMFYCTWTLCVLFCCYCVLLLLYNKLCLFNILIYYIV